MSVIKDKILIHFNTNDIQVFTLKDNAAKLLSTELVDFGKDSTIANLSKIIDIFFDKLAKHIVVVNNKHLRLYATGTFQQLNQAEQTKLIIHVYVNYGLYFNIIQPELEQFYLEQSRTIGGCESLMDGLTNQEFRKVVVCGSFQQHLKQIDDVVTVLHQRNIVVLSPWTTKVQPDTLGTDFILLEGQEPLKNERDSWKHKFEHMEKFKQSDAIIVCNPDGLVGKGTLFEFGFMIAYSKRIIFTEEPKNLSIFFPFEIGLIF